jgi:Zn-dependent protease with chaperone function
MPDWPGHAVQTAAFWCVALVTAAFLSALGYPLFRRGVRSASAATQSLAILAYALLSPAVATIVVLLGPGDALGWLIPDHCHQGQCAAHAPAVELWSPGGLSIAACASLLLIGSAAVIGKAFFGAHRRLRMLLEFGRSDERRAFDVLESGALVACCCGTFRPRVVISRGLLRRLSAEQMRLVVAHERAHAERYDNLRKSLLFAATIFWPHRLRSAIRADLATETEIACDAIALGRARISVFRSVAAVFSGQAVQSAATMSLSFASPDLATRLARVGTADRRGGQLPAVASIFLSCLLLVTVVTVSTHIGIEWIGG